MENVGKQVHVHFVHFLRGHEPTSLSTLHTCASYQ